jgi:hypothetical protein
VDLHMHSPIRLHGVVLKAQEQLYLYAYRTPWTDIQKANISTDASATHTSSARLYSYSFPCTPCAKSVDIKHGVGSLGCSWNSCDRPFASLHVTSSCAGQTKRRATCTARSERFAFQGPQVSCETCFEARFERCPWRSLSRLKRRCGGRTLTDKRRK